MKHLYNWESFNEGLSNKPNKKFPTDPAFHIRYIERVINDSGLNPDRLGDKGESFLDFCMNK